jgi:FkbM family methyltransferase
MATNPEYSNSSAGMPKPFSDALDPPGELDPERVVDAETDLGRLWVEKNATVLTRSLVEEGYWDPTISGLMRKVLEPGMTFVDAGANIGYFSVLGSQLVGPTGRVFAVEPDPVNLSILRANLSRHGCANTEVLPVAAWSERTSLKMMRPADEGAITQVGGTDGGQTVPAAPLDEMISGPVDYLKIDCELTDQVVVRGSKRLIRDNPSMLITVEFHPYEDTHTGESPSEILIQYRDMGLSPYRIRKEGDWVTPTSYEELGNSELPDGFNCFDFAMSKELPKRMLRPKGLLERAGDMLEYVPEAIRPRIRHRDRLTPRGS